MYCPRGRRYDDIPSKKKDQFNAMIVENTKKIFYQGDFPLKPLSALILDDKKCRSGRSLNCVIPPEQIFSPNYNLDVVKSIERLGCAYPMLMPFYDAVIELFNSGISPDVIYYDSTGTIWGNQQAKTYPLQDIDLTLRLNTNRVILLGLTFSRRPEKFQEIINNKPIEEPPELTIMNALEKDIFVRNQWRPISRDYELYDRKTIDPITGKKGTKGPMVFFLYTLVKDFLIDPDRSESYISDRRLSDRQCNAHGYYPGCCRRHFLGYSPDDDDFLSPEECRPEERRRRRRRQR
jgi:hypothetical protein